MKKEKARFTVHEPSAEVEPSVNVAKGMHPFGV